MPLQTFSPTFGIELEFIVVYEERAFTNKCVGLDAFEEEKEDIVSAEHAIYYMLNDVHRIPTTGWESELFGADTSYSKWMVKSEKLEPSDGEWAAMPATGYFRADGVELTSRILEGSSDWRGELQRVLACLREMETLFHCRFITNASTGLHVHIGNRAQEKTFPLATAKRIFQLVTAHEHLLDQIHSTNRITAPDPSTMLDWPRFAPPSFFHRLNDDHDESANLFHWLQSIELCATVAELGKLGHGDAGGIFAEYTDGHMAAYNFDNLFADIDSSRYEDDLKHTIEFRQHGGTLDGMEIVGTVELYLKIALYCHTENDMDFMHLLLQATNTEFSLHHLLSCLGCDGDLIHHFLRGETTTVGALPRPDFSTINPVHDNISVLSALVAQNHAEESARSDPSAVAFAVRQKYVTGFYGLIPSAGTIDITLDALSLVLNGCYMPVCRTPEEEMSKAQARAGMWERMARIYGEWVTGEPFHHQPAVWEALLDDVKLF